MPPSCVEEVEGKMYWTPNLSTGITHQDEADIDISAILEHVY